MKAAVVEAPNVLRVRDVPEPSVGDYDALCDVLYCAICTGTDTHIVEGNFPWLAPYPFILGHEAIGRVVKVGPKVRMYREGDLVTRVNTPPVGDCNITWGGFAQRAIARDHLAMKHDGVDASQWHSYRVNQLLPAGTDPAAATMVITWRETLSYLTRMGVTNGSSVLILGSGGNAMAFVNHARHLGACDITTIGSPDREPTARTLGATRYLNYRTADWTDRLASERPEGFDFVIDALGRVGMLDTALRFVAPGGTLGQYGIDDFGKCSLNPWVARGPFRYHPNSYDEAEAHEQVVSLMQSGQLDARPYLNLDSAYPLSDIPSAFTALKQRKHLKAVVQVQA